MRKKTECKLWHKAHKAESTANSFPPNMKDLTSENFLLRKYLPSLDVPPDWETWKGAVDVGDVTPFVLQAEFFVNFGRCAKKDTSKCNETKMEYACLSSDCPFRLVFDKAQHIATKTTGEGYFYRECTVRTRAYKRGQIVYGDQRGKYFQHHTCPQLVSSPLKTPTIPPYKSWLLLMPSFRDFVRRSGSNISSPASFRAFLNNPIPPVKTLSDSSFYKAVEEMKEQLQQPAPARDEPPGNDPTFLRVMGATTTARPTSGSMDDSAHSTPDMDARFRDDKDDDDNLDESPRAVVNDDIMLQIDDTTVGEMSCLHFYQAHMNDVEDSNPEEKDASRIDSSSNSSSQGSPSAGRKEIVSDKVRFSSLIAEVHQETGLEGIPPPTLRHHIDFTGSPFCKLPQQYPKLEDAHHPTTAEKSLLSLSLEAAAPEGLLMYPIRERSSDHSTTEDNGTESTLRTRELSKKSWDTSGEKRERLSDRLSSMETSTDFEGSNLSQFMRRNSGCLDVSSELQQIDVETSMSPTQAVWEKYCRRQMAEMGLEKRRARSYGCVHDLIDCSQPTRNRSLSVPSDDSNIAEEYFQEGLNYFYGLNGFFMDYASALHKFNKAAQLGHANAHQIVYKFRLKE